MFVVANPAEFYFSIMATSKSESSSQDLRCNKCRTTLNVDPGQIEDPESKNVDQSLIFLREDQLPEWIEKKVEEVILRITWSFLGFCFILGSISFLIVFKIVECEFDVKCQLLCKEWSYWSSCTFMSFSICRIIIV